MFFFAYLFSVDYLKLLNFPFSDCLLARGGPARGRPAKGWLMVLQDFFSFTKVLSGRELFLGSLKTLME